MEEVEMTKAKLKEKSEAEQVAFPNLLAEYLLEELLWLISVSEYAGHLWLKNPQILERKQKQDEDEALFLDFVYLTEEQTIKSGKMKPGQKISLKLAYMMLLAFLNKEKTPNIKWKGKAILKENGVEYEITGEFEEMIVPLRIRITELGEAESVPPEQKTVVLFVSEREITYLQYPTELFLAEQIGTILKQMELIPDMGSYLHCYEILMQAPLNGRHMRELLVEECEKAHILPEEERFKELESYRKYSYMEKKWKKYLRYGGKTTPNWQEVVDKLSQFLAPIWQAICKDEVFFGDWMPELGRYLD